ncbi:phenoloxidase-activating factor 2 isoform X1 [Pieris rapae]|uniref:phenoloxidase-activating factor 2 isoform X1 n=1 Tax=Pieris rapae TaxID=64459 RepID=UPI001E281581|nr:phenoloxidase-activating factor 2 isoform X1 [Pieris rapae]
MMNKLLVLIAVLSLAYCQDKSGDLDAVIKQIFGEPTAGPTPNTPSTIVPPVTQPASTDKPLSCKMDDSSPGECVRYYLCNANNSVITDGVGIIDIRVQDGPCPSYLDVCCSLPETRKPDNPITPAPPVDKQREGCGWRNPDGVGFRITGDKDGEAKFGEFPWMVAILNSEYIDPRIEPVNAEDPEGRKLNVYVGGGSLIHPGVVLTAAHYVAASRAFRVRAGEWDTQTTKEIYPYQDRDVNEIVIHKDFNKNNLFYDIALLFLSSPMEYAQNVGIVCLPPPKERTPAGAQCLASGWGKDKFGKEGRYQVILKKVEVPVVDRRSCQTALRNTRLGHFFELHSSFMCAGGSNGQDTCKGDGGSPLVCPIPYEKDRYMQSGIVAWGIGCGQDGTPGVYVDVANLRNWIDDKMAGKGIDPKIYTY